jgi:hypothetical protein
MCSDRKNRRNSADACERGCAKAAQTTGGGFCTVSAFPQSIVLRCRVTLPFSELRQMLLVDAINLGLHLGMPVLDQDREFADQPSRAKPVE